MNWTELLISLRMLIAGDGLLFLAILALPYLLVCHFDKYGKVILPAVPICVVMYIFYKGDMDKLLLTLPFALIIAACFAELFIVAKTPFRKGVTAVSEALLVLWRGVWPLVLADPAARSISGMEDMAALAEYKTNMYGVGRYIIACACFAGIVLYAHDEAIENAVEAAEETSDEADKTQGTTKPVEIYPFDAIFYPSALLLFFVNQPIAYKLIGITVWRLFWCIPAVLVAAYFFATAVKSCKGLKLAIVSIYGLLLVLLLGVNIFKNGSFTRMENIYKVPKATADVGEYVAENIKNPKGLVAEPLCYEIREVDGNIRTLYGRDMIGFIKASDLKVPREIALQLSSDEPDYDYIVGVIKEEGCNFMVVEAAKTVPEKVIKKYGISRLTEIDGYAIYKI
ncbi:MAG: hypothetical protein IKO61_11620 [Lachnospiraceae bacterium]|nr:hypothetical protein [Lachnospiraceae bacterium]